MHWIRLHGPWLAVWSPELQSTVKVPGHWSAPDLANWGARQDSSVEDAKQEPAAVDREVVGRRLRLERKFNRPTGLSPEQQCWVVCWVEGGVAEVRLNNGVLARSMEELPPSACRGAPAQVPAVAYRFYPADLLAFNTLTLSLPWEPTQVTQVYQVALGFHE